MTPGQNDPTPQVAYPSVKAPEYTTYPVTANGTLILILGIASIVILQIILGPIAWIMGKNALLAIDSGQADPKERSNVNAGRICGMVGTIIGIVAIVFWILWFAVIASIIGAGHAATRPM